MAPSSLISKFVNDLGTVIKNTAEIERPDISARFFTALEFVLTTGHSCLQRYQTNFDNGWPLGRVYDPSVKREFSYLGHKFTCTILNDPRLFYVLITFNEPSYRLISFKQWCIPDFDIDDDDNHYKQDNCIRRIEALEEIMYTRLFSKLSLNIPLSEKRGIKRDVILCNLPTELENLDPLDCVRNKTAEAFYNSIPEEDRQSVFDNYNDEAMLFSVINFIYASTHNCTKLDGAEFLPNHTYNSEKSKFEYGLHTYSSYNDNTIKFSISLLIDSVSGYFYLIIWKVDKSADNLNLLPQYRKEDEYVREFKLSKRIVPTMKNTDQDIYLDNLRFQLLHNLLKHILIKCVLELNKEPRSRSSSSRSSEDSDDF